MKLMRMFNLYGLDVFIDRIKGAFTYKMSLFLKEIDCVFSRPL